MNMPKQQVGISQADRKTILANHTAGKISDPKKRQWSTGAERISYW